MLQEIVLATLNKDKTKEIKEILKPLSGLKIKTLYQLNNLQLINEFKHIENGRTLRENAIKKAKFVSKKTGKWALSEDSGLFVNSLNGKPGINSSKFAGENATYDDNNNKLLKLLNGKPLKDRKARFKSVVVLTSPDGKTHIKIGEINGYISTKKVGRSGFGYDPIFLVPQYKKTIAQLGKKIKNKISHRAQAINKIIPIIERITSC